MFDMQTPDRGNASGKSPRNVKWIEVRSGGEILEGGVGDDLKNLSGVTGRQAVK
jgi:hypothetical protein